MRSPPQAGQPWASSTRSSGLCTSSSPPPSWRSAWSSWCAGGSRACRPSASPALCLVPQVQRCVQVPAERPESAVSAAALLGSADAAEAPEVHPDGRGEVEAAQPHGLPDRQPAVLPPGRRRPVSRSTQAQTRRWLTGSLSSTQVDVLESQFSQLLQLINSTRDFESIRLAHDHFLSNLLAQSFILLKPVSPLLHPFRPRC